MERSYGTLITRQPPRGYSLSKLVGVLADVHGDIVALDAALARLHQMGCDPISAPEI